MATLASTIGTAGSFLLVLVALLVGFSTNNDDQSDKLVHATTNLQQQLLGCSDKSSSGSCSGANVADAKAEVARAQRRLNQLGNLNRFEAVTGGLVVLGFLLGLAALLTNPVPGPAAQGRDVASIAAWKRAHERLKVKRRWIEASLAAQVLAILSIAALGLAVLSS
jgi:hypothetical protein